MTLYWDQRKLFYGAILDSLIHCFTIDSDNTDSCESIESKCTRVGFQLYLYFAAFDSGAIASYLSNSYVDNYESRGFLISHC
jgi:hypothetical protein